SAEFGGGETSCDACSKVLARSAEPAKSGNGGAELSAVVHRRGGQARSDIATGTLMLVCGFTFLRLEPIPRAAPMLARHAVVDFGKSTGSLDLVTRTLPRPATRRLATHL